MTYILAIDQGTTSSRAILLTKTCTRSNPASKNFNNISRNRDGLNMMQRRFGPLCNRLSAV